MRLNSTNSPDLAIQFLNASWEWKPDKAAEMLEQMEADYQSPEDQKLLQSCREIFEDLKQRPGDHPDDRAEAVRQMRDLLLGAD